MKLVSKNPYGFTTYNICWRRQWMHVV